MNLGSSLEYLWKATFCCHAADDPAAEEWVAVKALVLLAGRAAEAAGQIRAQADTEDLDTERRCGAEASIGYLRAKQEFLRYGRALAAGGR
ncbi:hypothetical protein [Nonomuraea guangzhouensis]|uniref:Uncharacterized protein n=1 Tax=Nonomuraea guangzhouensis TaxID=1291555 RepID=A0ABW4H055_9ACTN|nr:hypothetical protein [Nonomuraea guangzhouensis]